MKKMCFVMLAYSFFASQLVAAADFNGQFIFQNPAGAIHLSLEQSAEGLVTGSMYDGVSEFRLQGQTEGQNATGYIETEDSSDIGFAAQIDPTGKQLQLQVYPIDAGDNPVMTMSQYMTFARSAGSAAQPSVAGVDAMRQPIPNGGNSNVFINGKPLTRGQVASFEQQYQTKLVDGRFWYDDKCGAWGIEGGPTVGFIHPSLPLPGPMPPNVSGGGTGIFINGRELHPIDRQVLVGMFGMAIPGRYWLDAYGNLGIEGGGFLVNLAAAAQQARQKVTQTGSGTVSSGPEGAMFSGTNLSTGKPTFWYSGM